MFRALLVALFAGFLVTINADDFMKDFKNEMEEFHKNMFDFKNSMSKWGSEIADEMKKIPKNTVITNGINIQLSSCSQVCPENIFKCKVTKFTNPDRTKIITETLCYDPTTGTPTKNTTSEPNKYGSGKVYITSSLNG